MSEPPPAGVNAAWKFRKRKLFLQKYLKKRGRIMHSDEIQSLQNDGYFPQPTTEDIKASATFYRMQT